MFTLLKVACKAINSSDLCEMVRSMVEKLWDRLAKLPGVNNYWFDFEGKCLNRNSSQAMRVLTKEIL